MRRRVSLARRTTGQRDGFAGCRAGWAHARAPTQLRVLRPRPPAGVSGRNDLHLRVHLVPLLRRRRAARHLSELRRQPRAPADPPGRAARSRPRLDHAGAPRHVSVTNGGRRRLSRWLLADRWTGWRPGERFVSNLSGRPRAGVGLLADRWTGGGRGSGEWATCLADRGAPID